MTQWIAKEVACNCNGRCSQMIEKTNFSKSNLVQSGGPLQKTPKYEGPEGPLEGPEGPQGPHGFDIQQQQEVAKNTAD